MTPSPRRRRPRIHAWAILVAPPAGTALAIALALRDGLGRALSLFFVMYLATMIGVSVGFHRHATHGAFAARPAVRWVLLALGSMSAQGPLFYWVTNHRRHHHRADRPGDPHSPYFDEDRPIGGLRGFAHAHLGWAFDHPITNVFEYGKDLFKDPLLGHINRSYRALVAAGLVLPGVVGWLATGSLRGALLGVLWGGLARMLVVHHVSFAINSIAHTLGTRPFATSDRSRNNAVLAMLTAGEGWHNNHHAFPVSATFGLEPWQIDIGSWLVAGLERLSLASEVKRPSREAIAAKVARDDTTAERNTNA